ncbi:MAG TPA: TetR/AcrR family transcriptional regulator [Ktedonobacteraceae bacterium]|nr:TetR/AcrR family transcriptional regulator [Ktedonobacteraceae bacterium]
MEGSHHFPWHNGVPNPSVLHGRARHERRDAAEHRQRILEVAGRLFAEHGVDAVSMHQIAKVAGIGQGTLYRRYAHKGELCMDLMQECHERFMEDIATVSSTMVEASPLERLDRVLAYCVAFLEEQSALLTPVAAIDRRFGICDDHNDHDAPRRVSPYTMPIYLWLHDLFSGLFAEAVERGEIAPLDIPFTSDTMLATFNPLFYRFQRQERALSSEQILQGLRHIYIDGLKIPGNP